DAYVLRENDTGGQFRKRLKMFRGEVEESQAATPQTNINTVKEVDAVLSRSPTCAGRHWGFKAFVPTIGGNRPDLVFALHPVAVHHHIKNSCTVHRLHWVVSAFLRQPHCGSAVYRNLPDGSRLLRGSGLKAPMRFEIDPPTIRGPE